MKDEYKKMAEIWAHTMRTDRYGSVFEELDISSMMDEVNEDEGESEVDESVPVTREDRLFESFAKEAMRELAEQGLADFVLIRNDKLRTWWQGVLKKELEERIRKEKIAHKKALREQGLSKLSDEEKEALGLNKKKR